LQQISLQETSTGETEGKQMLITPQLSQEIERLLPQTQAQLAQALKQASSSMPLSMDSKEIESILLSVGDISLLIKRAANIVR
jgi:hypothetical protein